MWTHRREENHASTGLCSSSARPSLICSPGHGWAKGHEAAGSVCWWPCSQELGLRGSWTVPVPPVVTRPVPPTSLYRWVTMVQSWASQTKGPHPPALTHCLSGPRRKLVAGQAQLFCRESRPGSQAPRSGTALGSDGQVDKRTDGRTASCGWGPSSMCLVSLSWWVRPMSVR